MIVSIIGRRRATARILVDAALGDAAVHTDDAAAADVVVVLDTPAGTARTLAALPAESIVVAYADDSHVLAATRGLAARVVTVGLSPSNDVRAEAVESTLDATRFDLVSGGQRAAVAVGIPGESVVPLVLAALAVSAAAQRATADAIAALAPVREGAPHDMRAARPAPGVVVVDDTADGSPRSAADALKALAQFTIDGTRSVAVLGELDLPAGTDPVAAREEHDAIGRLVVRLNVSRLVVVGHPARHIHNAAGLEGSWDGESVLVDTAEQAYDLLNDTEFSASDAAPLVLLVKSGASAGLGDLGARLSNHHRTATA